MSADIVERLRIDGLAVGVPEVVRDDCLEAGLAINNLRFALLESRREHYVCDGDCWYSCPKSGRCCDESRDETKCDCGADEWNARVSKLITPR